MSYINPSSIVTGADLINCLKSNFITNVKDCGAIGNGISDDTVAVQLAIDSRFHVYFPEGTYIVSNLVLRDGSRLSGDGYLSVIQMKTGSTGDMILSGANGKRISIDNIRLYGGDDTSKQEVEEVGNRNGLRMNPSTVSFINNVWIHGFNKSGLALVSTYNTVSIGVNCNFSNVKTWNNFYGVNIESVGCEYLTFSGLISMYNRYGIIIPSGNITLGNPIIEVNYYGIYLNGVDSSNNGHGTVTGGLINHNNYALYADEITNGHNFSGCCMFGGILHIKNSTGINITGGSLSLSYYRFEGGGRNSIRNNFALMGAYGDVIQHNYNSSADDTVMVDNFKANGSNLE